MTIPYRVMCANAPKITDRALHRRAAGRIWCMARAQRTAKRAPEGAEPGISLEEDRAPVEPDLSGWTPHPSERRDFHDRIRAFPPSVSAWRRRLLERIRTGTPPLP